MTTKGEPTSPVRAAPPAFAKPIRFVSNDGLPHAKRRRISSACMTCRKRKTRCSGEKPTCETCRQNDHECLGYKEPAPQSRSRSSSAANYDQRPRNHHRTASHPTILPSQYTNVIANPPEPQYGLTAQVFEADLEPAQSKTEVSVKLEDESPPLKEYGLAAAPKVATSVPYFRYFGPTAIVPGYKQMVVEVRSPKPNPTSRSGSTSSSMASPTSTYVRPTSVSGPHAITEPLDNLSVQLPLYDPNGPGSNHPLITQLVNNFFIFVGANFPFLRQETFSRDVEAKRVEPILVDAVCAVAARFTKSDLLPTTHPSDAGAHFSERARLLVTDHWACPKLSAIQAYLLLAYTEFGHGKDSSLWMYLGTAIRMAQDLGLHKLEGVKGGDVGLERRDAHGGLAEPHEGIGERAQAGVDTAASERAREGILTFWSVYFLDRAVSSGVGRPVALKDKEIEIAMPSIGKEECPEPFPALIAMMRLYGKATNLINKLKKNKNGGPTQATQKLSQLATELSRLYHNLPAKLQFNPKNYEYYRKARKSSPFLLMHLWLHALYVLLDRPSLFEGSEHWVKENSEKCKGMNVSISSANTIAHILKYAGSSRDFIGLVTNPFNSQPIYIAACAFLSHAQEREQTAGPLEQTPELLQEERAESPSGKPGSDANMQKANPASAASEDNKPDTKGARQKCRADTASLWQGYQQCYRGIQELNKWWRGVKYILTVLDQKTQGIRDPLLYTDEEMENAEVQQWNPEVLKTFAGTLGKKRGAETEASGREDQDEDDAASMSEDSQATSFDLSKANAYCIDGYIDEKTVRATWLNNNRPSQPERSPPSFSPRSTAQEPTSPSRRQSLLKHRTFVEMQPPTSRPTTASGIYDLSSNSGFHSTTAAMPPFNTLPGVSGSIGLVMSNYGQTDDGYYPYDPANSGGMSIISENEYDVAGFPVDGLGYPPGRV